MKSNFFCLYESLLKRPQFKFHADTMSDSKVIRSKKPKFIAGSKFSCSTVFFSLSIFY